MIIHLANSKVKPDSTILKFVEAFGDSVLLINSDISQCIANSNFFEQFRIVPESNFNLDSFIKDKRYTKSSISFDNKSYDFFLFNSTSSGFDKFYSSVFNNAKSAIFFLRDSKFYHCNDFCLELFECSKHELIGTTPYDFSPLIQPGGLSARHSYYLIEQARLGNHQKFKWQHLSKKGKLFWLEVNLMPVEIDEEIFVQALTTDITGLINKNDLLSEQKQFSEAVLKSMGEALITTDTFGKITLMNPMAEKLTGWNFELAKSQHINSIINLTNAVSKYQANFDIKEIIQFGNVFAPNDAFILKSKNGRKYTINYNASPLLDSNNNIYGSIFIFAHRDLDKEVQKALQIDYAKFTQLYKHLPEAIAIVKIIRNNRNEVLDFILKEANTAYLKTIKKRTNLTEKDLKGKKLSELYPIHFQNYKAQITEAMDTGDASAFSDRLILGSFEIYANIRLIPLNKEYLCIVIEDVSEIKKYTEQLKFQKNKLINIYNTARNVAFILHDIDPPYTVREISPGGMQMFKIKELSDNLTILDFLLAGNLELVKDSIDNIKEQKTVRNVEVSLKRMDGEIFDALVNIQTFSLDHKSEIILSVIIDISEQKEAQRRLEELNHNLENIIDEKTMELKATLEELEVSNMELKELNESIAQETQKLLRLNEQLTASELELQIANETKNRFFSIIGHDLKNPVHALLLSIDILQMLHKQNNRAKTDQYLNNMKTHTLKLRLTLENLLSWAQSQQGKLLVNKERFIVSTVVSETIKFTIEQAKSKNIHILQELNCNSSVCADKNMIETVLRNIVTNAVKFTPNHGSITIATESTNSNVKFSISDTGVGMSGDVLKKLFRLDSHHVQKGTNQETGSGLGLILCKEFIEKNDGEIWAESTLGSGSVFHFTVPISK